MKVNLIKYLYVISYALSAEKEDNDSFAFREEETGTKYSFWKIERLFPGSPCIKLWNKYKDEWVFCGQFDLDIQKWYLPSKFEDEEDWL